MHSEPRNLGLTTSSHALDDVRVAMAQERRLGLRPTQVRVLDVEPVDGEDGTLWELMVESVDPLPEARHWTGAVMQRDLVTPDGGDGAWRADVLDVHPSSGSVWVEGERPTRGIALVWPFDYLAALDKLLHQPRWQALLPDFGRTLAASCGQADPAPRSAPDNHPAWSWSWSLVWGPPGTGKTYTLGRQVAALLSDPSERVLVLSTTNRATDAAALEVGEGLRERGLPIERAQRVGRALSIVPFRDRELTALLPEPSAVVALEQAQQRQEGPRIHRKREARDAARRLPGLSWAMQQQHVRVAISTLFSGTRLLTDETVLTELEQGRAPFTTVVVDEAGLVGRAQAAAVALLASRRVVLVGDPRQLSPISRATRSLPRHVMHWLARSGLEHLSADALPPQVHWLDQQRRMHPAIGDAVSALQYGGRLRNHPQVVQRRWRRGLRRLPRAQWYVLDAHSQSGAEGAASVRGPGGTSRVRPLTLSVLEGLFAAEPGLASVDGLFITPYVAQAAAVSAWLRERGLTSWTASTVHSQQGAEADVVLFDTVHASSTGWPPHEWVRLVNVGLSRARQLVWMLASRSEMRQGWLRPLLPHLQPRALVKRVDGWQWTVPDGVVASQKGLFAAPEPDDVPEAPAPDGTPVTLGEQLARRDGQRAVLSGEQRRLIQRELADAGPRLVRGVAGSGKTLVMAHWVVRTLRGQGFDEVVVLYANRSLRTLISTMLDQAWQQQHPGFTPAFPWGRVHLLHVAELLTDLRNERQIPLGEDRFDYEQQARAILQIGDVTERFPAVFIDEAQDLGHDVLKLVVELVHPHRGRKPVLVFYDNAQNLYGRKAPVWAELGLDMRGRSDVMRESFRSSRVIVETALNLVDRVTAGLKTDADMRERMNEGLLVQTERGHRPWWSARYCADQGQVPELYAYETLADEVRAVAQRTAQLVRVDGVHPSRIRIVTLSRTVREAVTDALQLALPEHPARHLTGDELAAATEDLVVTTPHSFKGFDADVVIVPGMDRFAPGGNLQSQALYVSLTRARTVLIATASRVGSDSVARQRLLAAFDEVREQLLHA